MTTDKHNVEIAGNMNIHHGISTSSSISIRHSLSRQHFWAARFFSEESHRIENIGMQGASDNDRKCHRAYVVGAIFSTIAALEASINELHQEAVDKSGNTLPGLTEQQYKLLAEPWAQKINYKKTPQKYQIVFDDKPKILIHYQLTLLLVDAVTFDLEGHLYKAVTNLVKLRNALVHYKSERDYEQKTHHHLKLELQGKFPLNPLSHADLWFPHRILGFGCAKWGLDTTSRFMSEFCKRMHIPDRL